MPSEPRQSRGFLYLSGKGRAPVEKEGSERSHLCYDEMDWLCITALRLEAFALLDEMRPDDQVWNSESNGPTDVEKVGEQPDDGLGIFFPGPSFSRVDSLWYLYKFWLSRCEGRSGGVGE